MQPQANVIDILLAESNPEVLRDTIIALTKCYAEIRTCARALRAWTNASAAFGQDVWARGNGASGGSSLGFLAYHRPFQCCFRALVGKMAGCQACTDRKLRIIC